MKKQNIGLYVLAIFVLGICVTLGVKAYNGVANTVMENVTIEAYNVVDSSGDELGAIPGPNVYYDMVFHGKVNMKEGNGTVAKTDTTATSTLVAENSGATYYLSASGTEIVLPTAQAGLVFNFVISGAVDTANYIIKSAEGDNIYGVILTGGVDYACSAEDQINFIADGELPGDFVELRSDGTNWFIGANGATTDAKITCTDPS